MKKEVDYKELAETYEAVLDEKNKQIETLKRTNKGLDSILSSVIDEGLYSEKVKDRLKLDRKLLCIVVVILTALNIISL